MNLRLTGCYCCDKLYSVRHKATTQSSNGMVAVNRGPTKQTAGEGKMCGRLTVYVSERVEVSVIQLVQAGPYFSIKVGTRGATQLQPWCCPAALRATSPITRQRPDVAIERRNTTRKRCKKQLPGPPEPGFRQSLSAHLTGNAPLNPVKQTAASAPEISSSKRSPQSAPRPPASGKPRNGAPVRCPYSATPSGTKKRRSAGC